MMCCCTEDLLAYVSAVGLGEDKERVCERLNAACGEGRRLRPSARRLGVIGVMFYLFRVSLAVFACCRWVATLSSVIASLRLRVQCKTLSPLVVLGDAGMEAWGVQPCGNRGEREANQVRPECSPQIGSDPACPRGRCASERAASGVGWRDVLQWMRYLQRCRRHAGQRGQVDA
jgi:hypothetical protein